MERILPTPPHPKSFLSLNKFSAEAKAIERIETLDKAEWIPVTEMEEDIDVNKIHARLKQRGYKTKLPCRDS